MLLSAIGAGLLALLAWWVMGPHQAENPAMDEMKEVATALLATNGLRLTSLEELQTLWAGYGHICRVKAVPADSSRHGAQDTGATQSLILKYIKPPASKVESHTLSGANEGHIRKILSYQAEQHFYTHLAPQLPASIAVAACVASIDSSTRLSEKSGDASTALLMTDLSESFPVAGEKRQVLSKVQTLSALRWLAEFHGFWWSRLKGLDREHCVAPPLEHFERFGSTTMQQPGGVWRNGGYTYLATRMTEFEGLCADESSNWRSKLCERFGKESKSVAELVARVVSPGTSDERILDYEKFETLIHGDVKSENLFTSASGDAVAFYDFQYVGLGLGACDLAKFFTCSVPLEMILDDQDTTRSWDDGMGLGMSIGEERLLRQYLASVSKISGKTYPWDTFVRHWETALVDWLRFQASWGFWGNTQWLEARVTAILADEGWRAWLLRILG